jgi:glucuronate isomerase
VKYGKIQKKRGGECVPKKENDTLFLSTEAAKELYRDVASRQASPAPTVCHGNIAARWLSFDAVAGAMRAVGVDEAYITGDASDFEKLEELLAVMPQLVGHRAALWCRHDLSSTFGCTLDLVPENAEAIWRETALVMDNCQPQNPAVFTPVSALIGLERGVKHAALALGASVGQSVTDLASFCDTYCHLLDDFAAAGGKAVALTVDPATPFVTPNEFRANEVLVRALQKDGRGITVEEKALFRAQMVRFFGKECVRRGLALHLHAERLAPGVAAAVPAPISEIGGLAALLQYLCDAEVLPRTLLVARNAAELCALSPLFTAFAAVKAKEPRLLPALSIPSCFDPTTLRAELASIASLVPLGALTPLFGEPQELVRDVFARVLCDLFAEQCERGLFAGGTAAAKGLILTILS